MAMFQDGLWYLSNRGIKWGFPQEVCKIKGQGLLPTFLELPPFGKDKMVAHSTMNSAALLGKRENQDAQMSPLSSFSKRPRLTPTGPDGIQQQQRGPHMDGLHESEMNRNNSLLQKQIMSRGIQYANAGIQKYPHQMLDGVLHQNAAAATFSAGHSDDGNRNRPFGNTATMVTAKIITTCHEI
ncbi:hypothetical protein OIU78_014295 [Salix suchowensis]|nr:hypothetical protein OIU78_014295 [Salix suchowensis]